MIEITATLILFGGRWGTLTSYPELYEKLEQSGQLELFTSLEWIDIDEEEPTVLN